MSELDGVGLPIDLWVVSGQPWFTEDEILFYWSGDQCECFRNFVVGVVFQGDFSGMQWAGLARYSVGEGDLDWRCHNRGVEAMYELIIDDGGSLISGVD